MNDVERVRVYEKDHSPDGFSAVEMAILTRLADSVDELEAECEHLKNENDRLRGIVARNAQPVVWRRTMGNKKTGDVCVWTEDEDGQWFTKCGHGFEFTNYGWPLLNKFQFCAYCGGLLHEKRYEEKMEDEE